MKTKILRLLQLFLFLASARALRAQTTAFTYQGQLQDGGNPATGVYNFSFSLFNTNSGGLAIAGPVTNAGVAVSGSLFATLVDFGAGPFTGLTNWLQVSVATNGSSAFTALTPRQLVTPVPYAIFAYTASNVNGTLSATQLSGTLPLARLSGITSNQMDSLTWQRATNLNGGRAALATNVVSGISLTNAFVTNSTFAGNGAGLTNLIVTALAGGTLGGRAGLDGIAFGTNAYLAGNPLYLLGNAGTNHTSGLGYNGNGVTNFPNVAVQPNGPVLWGQGGGVLGVLGGVAQPVLLWTNSSVSVNGTLTASNFPALNWSGAASVNLTIPSGGMQIDTCTNARPAPGFFLILASATVNANGNNVTLHLLDTTPATPVDLYDAYGSGSGDTTIAISWVVPITAASTPQSFAVNATSSGANSAIYGHNLTVLYVP